MQKTIGCFTFERLSEGLYSSNTYILWDETKEAAIIDAGNSYDLINEVVKENNLKVKYIIITHVHYDHILCLDEIRKMYKDARVICHERENSSFDKPHKNASLLFGSAKTYEKADLTVKDNDVLYLGSSRISIILTPGHTEGGICILADKFLFTGDTLFYRTYGRTDLVGGNPEDMEASLCRLYNMDPDLIVLPGHGTISTIGDEKENNPYMGG